MLFVLTKSCISKKKEQHKQINKKKLSITKSSTKSSKRKSVQQQDVQQSANLTVANFNDSARTSNITCITADVVYDYPYPVYVPRSLPHQEEYNKNEVCILAKSRVPMHSICAPVGWNYYGNQIHDQQQEQMVSTSLGISRKQFTEQNDLQTEPNKVCSVYMFTCLFVYVAFLYFFVFYI